MDIKKYVEAETPRLIELRRYFHENPEGSQKEFKTMDFIEGKLQDLGPIRSLPIPSSGNGCARIPIKR